MKKATMSFCILLVIATFTANVFAKMPAPEPQALWEYITKESPYTQWSFWPDHKDMQPGQAPHGPFHKVYVNDATLQSSHSPVQYDSIVVKENYGKDKALKAITVMYKVSGYNPDSGDWFWAKYSPEGNADKFGKPQGCISCHGANEENDYVFVHEFK